MAMPHYTDTETAMADLRQGMTVRTWQLSPGVLCDLDDRPDTVIDDDMVILRERYDPTPPRAMQ